MNWYFEEQGVSKGPFPEGEFAQMVEQRQVSADALVWRPGMEEWATVREINPAWLKMPAAAGQEPNKQKAAAPPSQSPPSEEPLPVIETAIPTEPAAPVRAPAQSKLRLQAPTPAHEPSGQPAEKGGLLKRVFGFGGKKKG